MSARGPAGDWSWWAFWDEETGALDFARTVHGSGLGSVIPGMPRNDKDYAALIAERWPGYAHWSPRGSAGGVWRVWDGRMHRPDDSELVHRMLIDIPATELAICAWHVQEHIRRQVQEAEPRQRDRLRAELEKQAAPVLKLPAALGKASGHSSAMLKLRTALGKGESEFTDRYPEHLNCPDGIWSLRSLSRYGHDPRAMMSYLTPLAPDWSGRCQRFRALVRHLAGYQPAVEEFYLRVLGYGLLGDNREQVWVWFLGQTQSGKSVLQELLRLLLGTLATEGGKDLVRVSRNGAHARDQLNLRGRRMVFFPEWSDYDHADETQYKRLTGESRLSVHELYATSPTDIVASFLPVTFTNDMPTIGDADEAVIRRTIVVPAGQTIPPEHREMDLAARIFREEGPAILALLMRECAAYLGEGRLVIPHEVMMETQRYLGTQKRETDFIMEHCDFKPDGTADGRALWTLWERWSESRSVRLSRRKFYERVGNIPGVTRERNGSSVQRFRGIVIRSEHIYGYPSF